MIGCDIAIVGATGNIGRKVVEQLLQKKIVLPENLYLFASSKSSNKTITINDQIFNIYDTSQNAFTKSKICIFTTESYVSLKYVPIALQAGCYVIDSSSQFRLKDSIPLIVPPVNGNKISPSTKFYTTANCLAVPTTIVVSPLYKTFGVRRVQIVTYQSTSGAGKDPMDECLAETRSVLDSINYKRKYFHRPIAFNIIPQIGEIIDEGITTEEYKIIQETKKILSQDIQVSATAVRVPVMVGHSIALSIELLSDFDLEKVITLYNSSPAIKLSKNHYTTPIEVVGKDEVYIGRIRRDPTVEFGLQLWTCSDNLRRGASTDIVEIVSTLINKLN